MIDGKPKEATKRKAKMTSRNGDTLGNVYAPNKALPIMHD